MATMAKTDPDFVETYLPITKPWLYGFILLVLALISGYLGFKFFIFIWRLCRRICRRRNSNSPSTLVEDTTFVANSASTSNTVMLNEFTANPAPSEVIHHPKKDK